MRKLRAAQAQACATETCKAANGEAERLGRGARVMRNEVGQVVNLRPAGNRPNRPIANRPQDTILPHDAL